MKQKFLIFQVIVVAIGTMTICGCREAGAWSLNPFRIFQHRSQSDPALCIGGTFGSIFHLREVRGIIVDMNKSCQSDTVDTKDMYVAAVRPTTRKILYSFTHGVVSISYTCGEASEDTTQHIFLGLGLVSWDDFSGVPREKWVQHSDLPTCSSYSLVFINACHSGDVALEYTDSQSRSSAATNFRNKFPNAVYIAARGGNNGNPIVHQCSKCLNQTTAMNLAVDFFTRIRDRRAANENPTFYQIKEQWDPEWDQQNPPQYHPENSHYIIYGGDTKIRTVFP